MIILKYIIKSLNQFIYFSQMKKSVQKKEITGKKLVFNQRPLNQI